MAAWVARQPEMDEWEIFLVETVEILVREFFFFEESGPIRRPCEAASVAENW